MEFKGVNDAANPPKGGPAETGGLTSSNLPLFLIGASFRTKVQARPRLTLLCRYLCIYNFITPTHFRFNSRELLTSTNHCLPVYTGAPCNHFVYTAEASGSVKGQYASVRMVLVRPPISNSFSPLSKLSRTIPSAPTTIGITVTHMFHSFLSSQVSSKYWSLFSFFLILILWTIFRPVLPFIIRSGLLAGIRWSVYMSKSQRILCVLFSRADSYLCM